MKIPTRKTQDEGRSFPSKRTVGLCPAKGDVTMTIHIHVDSMKSAEHLSSICKDYSNELYLRSEKFCIDPKSTLGILAMMYSARDTMYLDTGDLGDRELPKFLKAIDSYIVKDEE